MSEEIHEQGFVLKSENGIAEIALTNSEACDSCDSLFCSANSKGQNILLANNEINAKPGDYVKVVVAGSALVKATILLYVVPMIVLVLSVVIFYSVFKYSELVSFGASLVTTAAYYLILLSTGIRKKDKKPMPKVVSIKDHPASIPQ